MKDLRFLLCLPLVVGLAAITLLTRGKLRKRMERRVDRLALWTCL